MYVYTGPQGIRYPAGRRARNAIGFTGENHCYFTVTICCITITYSGEEICIRFPFSVKA